MSITPRDSQGAVRPPADSSFAMHGSPRQHPMGAPGPRSRPGSPFATGMQAAVPPVAAEPLGAPMPIPAFGPPTPINRKPATSPSEMHSRYDVDDLESDPEPGTGRHVVGFLLGLLMTPVGVLLLGVGLTRLAAVAGTADMGTDTRGMALLAGGVVALACVVLLGSWSPAVPITGGLVWGIGLGAAYLVAPEAVAGAVTSLAGSLPTPVAQLAQTAMSGQLVVVGSMLLAAGVATAAGRRRGQRWAEEAAAAAERTSVPREPSHQRRAA